MEIRVKLKYGGIIKSGINLVPRNIYQNVPHNFLSWTEDVELSFLEAKQRRKIPSLQHSQCS